MWPWVEMRIGEQLLTYSSSQILFAYEDELGEDVIASLDFWGRPQSPSAR